MSKGPSIILRIYFAVVAAVTLFTLMFGTIDLLTIGLKRFVIRAADVPEWGLENCDNTTSRYPEAKIVDDTTKEYTAEELKAMCEARNADAVDTYRRQQASNAVRNLALIIVSLPLFILHFRVVYRDWKAERNEK